MIDWMKPIRLKKSQKQVYAVGYLERYGTDRIVGPERRWGSGGIPYNNYGLPEQECPWGEIENFDPLEEDKKNWKDVPSPAAKVAARQVQAQLEDSPLFSLWS